MHKTTNFQIFINFCCFCFVLHFVSGATLIISFPFSSIHIAHTEIYRMVDIISHQLPTGSKWKSHYDCKYDWCITSYSIAFLMPMSVHNCIQCGYYLAAFFLTRSKMRFAVVRLSWFRNCLGPPIDRGHKIAVFGPKYVNCAKIWGKKGTFLSDKNQSHHNRWNHAKVEFTKKRWKSKSC